jgi:hypothetical protein
MQQTKKKVVQTELEASEYEVLQSVAKKKRMTIKEAVREALRSWNASNSDLSKDSLFQLKPVPFKLKVPSDEIDSFLYGKTKRKDRH